MPKKRHYGNIPGRYKAAQKFYSSKAWRSLRDLILIENPFCCCERCEKSENPLPANVVDHNRPINHNDPYDTQNGKYGEPLDRKNLTAMNSSCHNRKTAIENASIYKYNK